LKRSLWSAVALLLASCATPQPTRAPLELAITVDDLPVHGGYPNGVTPQQVSDRMLAALKAGGVPAYGFVNAVKAQDQPETEQVLADWHVADMVLGNHGWSHRHLSEMSLGEFEDELTKNEAVLAKHGAGTDWRWFRYPFLDEGKDAEQRGAARRILAKHGYRVAAVSISFGDWQWTEPYRRCVSASDQAGIAELERMYLASAEDNIQTSRDAAHKLFGRDVPYVLLMHVSAMSARMMPRLLQLYRGAGFRFVSLPQAERDPVYRAYTDLNLPAPPSPQELAKAKGVSLQPATDYAAKLETMCTTAPH
jgi:peptidoglycan/xylan/chitin deacetylase (PgdA/CDA1 family)